MTFLFYLTVSPKFRDRVSYLLWFLSRCFYVGAFLCVNKFQEIGEGREAWRVAVHGVAKSWTRLSDWTTFLCRPCESTIVSSTGGVAAGTSFPRVCWPLFPGVVPGVVVTELALLGGWGLFAPWPRGVPSSVRGEARRSLIRLLPSSMGPAPKEVTTEDPCSHSEAACQPGRCLYFCPGAA